LISAASKAQAATANDYTLREGTAVLFLPPVERRFIPTQTFLEIRKMQNHTVVKTPKKVEGRETRVAILGRIKLPTLQDHRMIF